MFHREWSSWPIEEVEDYRTALMASPRWSSWLRKWNPRWGILWRVYLQWSSANHRWSCQQILPERDTAALFRWRRCYWRSCDLSDDGNWRWMKGNSFVSVSIYSALEKKRIGFHLFSPLNGANRRCRYRRRSNCPDCTCLHPSFLECWRCPICSDRLCYEASSTVARYLRRRYRLTKWSCNQV